MIVALTLLGMGYCLASRWLSASVASLAAAKVSTDGGGTWQGADVLPPLSELSRSPWRFSWTPTQEAEHTLVVRALDGDGQLQSALSRPSFPRGADGYHRVHITVAR